MVHGRQDTARAVDVAPDTSFDGDCSSEAINFYRVTVGAVHVVDMCLEPGRGGRGKGRGGGEETEGDEKWEVKEEREEEGKGEEREREVEERRREGKRERRKRSGNERGVDRKEKRRKENKKVR